MDSYKFIDGVYVYFVTFTIIDWLPIFNSPEPVEIINESLRYCINNKNLRIHAYAIMPNHIHLIVYDSNFDNDRLGKTLTEFRKFTGNKLANYIDNTLSDSLSLVIRSKVLNDRIRQVWRQAGMRKDWLVKHFYYRKCITYTKTQLGKVLWNFLNTGSIHLRDIGLMMWKVRYRSFLSHNEQW